MLGLWRTPRFAFLNLGHLFTHMFLLLYTTVVLSLGPVFGATYDELIALSTASFVALGLGTLPAGWLADRWSRDAMMVLFFLGIGGAAIVTGLADGPVGLGVGLALIGLFAAIYHPVGIALVADCAPADRLGKALGFNGVFGNLGVAAAGIVAGGLTEWISWRAAFILPGALSIATGLAYLALVRPARSPDAAAKNDSPAPLLTRRQQVAIIAALLAGTLAGGFIFDGTIVAMPKLVEERIGALGGSTASAGGIVTIIFAVAAVAQIVVGHLIDRYPLKTIYVAITFLQAPALLAVAFAAEWTLFAAAIVTMLLIFGELPVGDTLVGRFVAGPWRSRVYAASYVISFGTSAGVVPVIALLWAGGGGFTTLMVVLAGLAGVSTLCALALPAVVNRRAALPAAAPA